MAAGRSASRSAFFGDRLQGGREPDVSGNAVVRRRGIPGAAPASAGRDASRHDDDRRNPVDAEQAEEARVDGDPGSGPGQAPGSGPGQAPGSGEPVPATEPGGQAPGLRAAEPIPDLLRGRRQAANAHAAQQQRRAAPGGVARPLPPARGRDGQAGEDQDFRRAGTRSREPAGMALGRERDGGGTGCARQGLPGRVTGPLQRTVDDRAGPRRRATPRRFRRPCAGRPRPGCAPRHRARRRVAAHPPAPDRTSPQPPAGRSGTALSAACRKRCIGLSFE